MGLVFAIHLDWAAFQGPWPSVPARGPLLLWDFFEMCMDQESPWFCRPRDGVLPSCFLINGPSPLPTPRPPPGFAALFDIRDQLAEVKFIFEFIGGKKVSSHIWTGSRRLEEAVSVPQVLPVGLGSGDRW